MSAPGVVPKDLRCNRCLGMGYHGRSVRGKWKIVTCRRCGGRGECDLGQRNASYTFRKVQP